VSIELIEGLSQVLCLRALCASALPAACLVYAVTERRGRKRWEDDIRVRSGNEPYRTAEVVVARRTAAPLLVRAVSLGCIVFGCVFAPVLLTALVRLPLDGMAAAIAGGFFVAVSNVACALRMLDRSEAAIATMRTQANALLLVSGTLLLLSLTHFGLVQHPQADGIELTVVGVAFAAIAVPQAVVLIAAARLLALDSRVGEQEWSRRIR